MKETKKETDPNWGGKREGAGRKAPGAKGPLTHTTAIRVTEESDRRIRALREATKNDDLPFNRMFEKWVKELAEAYGIE